MEVHEILKAVKTGTITAEEAEAYLRRKPFEDLGFIYDTCQRVILLAENGIAVIGSTKEVLRNQALLEKHGLELPLSFSRV